MTRCRRSRCGCWSSRPRGTDRELLLADQLGEAAGRGDVAGGQRRQRRGVELVDVARVRRSAGRSCRRGRRPWRSRPERAAAQTIDDLLLLLGEHHIGAGHLRSSPSRHHAPRDVHKYHSAQRVSSVQRHARPSVNCADIQRYISRRPSMARASVSLVGVLQLAADRARRWRCGWRARPAAGAARQVDGGRLPLDAGAGGQDASRTPARRRPSAPRRSADQLGDPQIVGADAVQRATARRAGRGSGRGSRRSARWRPRPGAAPPRTPGRRRGARPGRRRTGRPRSGRSRPSRTGSSA